MSNVFTHQSDAKGFIEVQDQQSQTNMSNSAKNLNWEHSQRTLFSEFETIEITIKIIDLLSILHQNNIVHTNLAPETIFLRKGSINDMCFLGLYHVSWKAKELLNMTGFQGPDYEDNLSLYDIRCRNRHYVSSEQINIFELIT